MYNKVLIYQTNEFNPYQNLAIESVLFDMAQDDILIIYLWQNDNTVVIGRNQNAYLDVNVKKLYDDGGKLARRSTGGGAVYHDLGNLNFSFISGNKNFDIEANNRLIINAVKSFGVEATITGRNDIAVDGRKISGNAYYKNATATLHHGTLLIKTDKDKMEKYLNVNPDKFIGKGVSSVKARTVNLSTLSPKITIDSMKDAIIESAKSACTVVQRSFLDLDESEISDYQKKYADADYLLGKNIKLKSAKYNKFDWGYADVRFTVSGGIIESIKIFTDSLDVQGVEEAENALIGETVFYNNKNLNSIAQDVLNLINE